MKILFSPEYSGHVYARSITDSVMMDTTVANTLRLVEIMACTMRQPRSNKI